MCAECGSPRDWLPHSDFAQKLVTVRTKSPQKYAMTSFGGLVGAAAGIHPPHTHTVAIAGILAVLDPESIPFTLPLHFSLWFG